MSLHRLDEAPRAGWYTTGKPEVSSYPPANEYVAQEFGVERQQRTLAGMALRGDLGQLARGPQGELLVSQESLDRVRWHARNPGRLWRRKIDRERPRVARLLAAYGDVVEARDRLALALRYGLDGHQPHTVTSAGKVLGVSAARVSQLSNRARATMERAHAKDRKRTREGQHDEG